MSTARSWTDELADLRALVAFRLAGQRSSRRRRLRWLVPGLITVSVLLVGMLAGLDADPDRTDQLRRLFPVGCLAFLGLVVVSAVASGGGRELLPRDGASAYPVSPVVDHLGALLLAPLSVAWLFQAWTLLGVVSYLVAPAAVLPAVVVVLAWLCAATAAGQVAGWAAEAVRRTRHGKAWLRGALAVGILAVTGLALAGPGVDLGNPSGLRFLTDAARHPFGATWLVTVVGLLLATVALVLLGALPARSAARRLPRDEARLETGNHPARPHPTSDFAALHRIDRASVLRSLPLRRGLITLGISPGLIALAADLDWDTVILLPGLAASGGALLFGVNAWCLDARGALWRESLPVSAGLAFTVRATVLLELLLAASAVSVLLGSLRAGVPTLSQGLALACIWVVAALMVVSASMRWSLRKPFAVDLRSARATPAPPGVMVGYSGRLALATTVVSLFFSGLAVLPWPFSIGFALPLLLVSLLRLRRARRGWEDPFARSRVVVTVAA
ncbi:MAG: hypothetical protein ABWX84_06300 [Nocardioides sp.]